SLLFHPSLERSTCPCLWRDKSARRHVLRHWQGRKTTSPAHESGGPAIGREATLSTMPTPGMVCSSVGLLGSSSSLRRRRCTVVRTKLRSDRSSYPQTSRRRSRFRTTTAG